MHINFVVRIKKGKQNIFNLNANFNGVWQALGIGLIIFKTFVLD